jgi:hypothetical protein
MRLTVNPTRVLLEEAAAIMAEGAQLEQAAGHVV